LYRSYENLIAFGVRGAAYSAGWAVGSFFVPFVNLVVPYRAVRELWNRSLGPSLFVTSAAGPPAWFPLWWTFWLLSNFSTNFYFRLSDGESMSREALAALGIASDALTVIAAIFAIVVVDMITTRQEETARSETLNIRSGPPAPPSAFPVNS
jgi:hypothetical protein